MAEAFSRDGLLHVTKDDAAHKYQINGVDVPSVTQILGCLQKGGLSWWGMRVGVTGVIKLVRSGDVQSLLFANPTAEEKIEDLLKLRKLTVNHTLDKAADRGSTVHDAAEQYALTGSIPNLKDYPDTEQGYVRAFCKFVIENEPEFEASELIVGYAPNRVVGPLIPGDGFAGTFDGIATFKKGTHAGSRALIDYKTSKGVYPDSHFPQLEAYEAAYQCMGGAATDKRLLIRLGKDGEYEIAESCATFDTFLGIKSAFDAVADLKQRVKDQKKAAKAAA